MITLMQANRIVDAALEAARGAALKPMTVAVLDAGGHLVAFQREDRCGILRPDIAFGKAWGALGMGCGTRLLAERAESHPSFFVGLAAAARGRVLPAAGGVLVKGPAGEVLGAVGVSGDLPEQDERCAVAGIEAVGLLAQVGA